MKKAFDLNYCCIRRVLRSENPSMTVCLILVKNSLESSQTRKRSLSSVKDVVARTITLENLTEASLSKAQQTAILAIANASSFRQDKCNQILRVISSEEEEQIDRLSQNLADSQISNFSDDLPKPKTEQPAISKLEMKAISLKLVTEDDIPPQVVSKVMTEIADRVEPSFDVLGVSTMRTYFPCLKYLLTEQAEDIIRDSKHLTIGIDSTTISGKEFSSFTLMTDENASIILDIDYLPDHKSKTVADQFSRRFGTLSVDTQQMLAEKVQGFNTDRAPAALGACKLVDIFLNEQHQRDRCTIPCSMHLHSMQEKKLRESFTTEFKQYLLVAEKYLSKSRVHRGKKMHGEEFEDFLKIKLENGQEVLPKCFSLYSNVRFGVMCGNLQVFAINYDEVANFLQLRCNEPTIAENLRKEKVKIFAEIIATVLVNECLASPLWSQTRVALSSESFATLEEQFLLSCENIVKAASPTIALTIGGQNLMFQNNENRLHPMFEKIVRAYADLNFALLNDLIKEKVAIVRQVCLDYKVKSDISVLEGELIWNNQNCERSMGYLKRSYERRFNLAEENLCLISAAMYNAPVSYWMQKSMDKLKQAFGHGVIKTLAEQRKRARLDTNQQKLRKESERQNAEAREKLLFDRIGNFIPKTSKKVFEIWK